MFKFIFIAMFITICNGQDLFQRLESVPDEFKKAYSNAVHNYNPLNVGNVWEYYDSEWDESDTEKIVKDTLLNGKRYFKRITRFFYNWEDLYRWERNDSLTGVTYYLDIDDSDGDGNTLEEFLIDSLEVEDYTEYESYKFCFPAWDFPKVIAYVDETGWAVVWGDTVQYRSVQYLGTIIAEIIVDKYGLLAFQAESPMSGLAGAIIDGVHYGTLSGIENSELTIPDKIELNNNYPNPFNPQTTISFSTSKTMTVKLIVYTITGQEIITLIDGKVNAGKHKVVFSGNSLPSGVYIYRIEYNLGQGSYFQERKMILLK